MKPKTNADGWALVLSRIGRATLANCVGLTRQALYKWHEVPLKHVVAVEKATQIPREMICPENREVFQPSRIKYGEAEEI